MNARNWNFWKQSIWFLQSHTMKHWNKQTTFIDGQLNNCSNSQKELRPWLRATNKTFVPLFQSKSIYVYLRVCTKDSDKSLWHVTIIPGNLSLEYRCRWPCLADNHTRGCCKCFLCHCRHWPPPGPMRPGTPGPSGRTPWSLSPLIMTSLTTPASCHILHCCIGHSQAGLQQFNFLCIWD